MKLSRRLAFIVLPLAAVLAGCYTVQPQQAPTEQVELQYATLEVYAASNNQVKGYRAYQISEKQTIYVSEKPIITRANLTSVETGKDQQARAFVRLGLEKEGVAAFAKVPKNRGYVTVVNNQVSSFSGRPQGNEFVFLVRDEAVAEAISRAVAGVPAQPAK